MEQQIKQALWMLIEEHYNVDRNLPHVLTAKRPFESNQIDKIAETLASAIAMLLMPSESKIASEEEISNCEKNRCNEASCERTTKNEF